MCVLHVHKVFLLDHKQGSSSPLECAWLAEPSSPASAVCPPSHLRPRAELSHPRPRVFPQEKERCRRHRSAARPSPAARGRHVGSRARRHLVAPEGCGENRAGRTRPRRALERRRLRAPCFGVKYKHFKVLYGRLVLGTASEQQQFQWPTCDASLRWVKMGIFGCLNESQLLPSVSGGTFPVETTSAAKICCSLYNTPFAEHGKNHGDKHAPFLFTVSPYPTSPD